MQPKSSKSTFFVFFTHLLAGVIAAITVHILDPLIAKNLFQIGPFWTDTEYPLDKATSYKIAAQMYRKAAKEEHNSILNVRSTLFNKEQDALVDTIREVIRSTNLMATRCVHHEIDPNWTHVKELLSSLGDRDNFKIVVLLTKTLLPSCVINDKEAILGFNDALENRISTGFYIKNPPELAKGFKGLYDKIITDPRLSVVVKDFQDLVKPENIDSLIRVKQNEAKIKLMKMNQ